LMAKVSVIVIETWFNHFEIFKMVRLFNDWSWLRYIDDTGRSELSILIAYLLLLCKALWVRNSEGLLIEKLLLFLSLNWTIYLLYWA
jgi:hypothetical protein